MTRECFRLNETRSLHGGAGESFPTLCSLLSIGVCLKDKAVTGRDWTPTIINCPISQGLLNSALHSFQSLHFLSPHYKTGLVISIALYLALESVNYFTLISYDGLQALHCFLTGQ